MDNFVVYELENLALLTPFRNELRPALTLGIQALKAEHTKVNGSTEIDK
jgi:hypothetical protein